MRGANEKPNFGFVQPLKERGIVVDYLHRSAFNSGQNSERFAVSLVVRSLLKRLLA